MHRNSVDLPEPDAPMRQMTSDVRHVERDLPQHRLISERLRDAVDRQLGEPARSSDRRPEHAAALAASSQSVNRVSGIDTQRNNRAAATYGVKLKSSAFSMPAWRSTSTGPTMLTRATSFWRLTKSFINGGTTRRTAWGSTTWRIVWLVDSPSDRAAARWLSWMLSMPARNTSAT